VTHLFFYVGLGACVLCMLNLIFQIVASEPPPDPMYPEKSHDGKSE
jgi:hypothetical protein